jgi:hypothetical protein
MNIKNLNQQEVEQLQMLLNKMNPSAIEKASSDPIDEMIDDIMDEFNFAKVQNVMNHLNWKWLGEYVTIEMLREEARRLLKGAAFARLHEYRDEHWEQGIQNSTGGFQAMAFCNESKSKIIALDLKFVLSQWYTEIED